MVDCKNSNYLLLLPLGLLLANFFVVYSQNTNDTSYYFNPKLLQYKDCIYKESIKTAQLQIPQLPNAAPLIPLNGGFSLVLSFDELGDEAQNYSYTLIHCNADWQPSRLHPFDYINGFSRDDITNYEFSFNTTTNYTHYRLNIPNSSMQIIKSGNYLLKVYQNDDPNDLILTKRFMVFENKVNINATYAGTGLSAYFQTHQRINFTIQYRGYNITNPLEEIKVLVLQNGRWDNALDLQPVFLRSDELVYNHMERMLFEGSNEFRFFDIRNVRLRGQRVRAMQEIDDEIHVYLTTDFARNRKSENRWVFRVNQIDRNGRYLVETDNWGITNLDAEYAYVHFSLAMDQPINNGNIYVFGELSDWEPQPNFQMRYNYNTNQYEAQVLLKQGIYDYMYVVKKDGDSKLSTAVTEGNYLETENDYYILVYHTNFFRQFDELIAVRQINTRR